MEGKEKYKQKRRLKLTKEVKTRRSGSNGSVRVKLTEGRKRKKQ